MPLFLLFEFEARALLVVGNKLVHSAHDITSNKLWHIELPLYYIRVYSFDAKFSLVKPCLSVDHLQTDKSQPRKSAVIELIAENSWVENLVGLSMQVSRHLAQG